MVGESHRKTVRLYAEPAPPWLDLERKKAPAKLGEKVPRRKTGETNAGKDEGNPAENGDSKTGQVEKGVAETTSKCYTRPKWL